MSSHHVTLKDLAGELNISIATVSRALNGSPALSKSTIDRVQKLAEERGYSPNFIAYNLKKQKSKTIGIVVPSLSHHYFASMIQGAQEHFYQNGYNTVICQSFDQSNMEKEAVNVLVNSRLDGILISMSSHYSDTLHLEKLIARNFPIVLFDRYDFNLESRVSSVTVDDFQGAYEVTSRLIAKGYKKLAFVGLRQSINIGYNRLAGFRKAMQDHSLPVDQRLIFETAPSFEAGYDLANTLKEKNSDFDAIVCTSGLATLAFYTVFRAYTADQYRPPIGLAGFLNDLYPGFSLPNLPRVNAPTLEMGIQAAEILLQKITQDKDHVYRKVLPITVIEK